MGDRIVERRGQGEPGDAPTQARLDALIARLGNEHLEVLPFYHDLRNEIVRPLNLHVETRYFFRRWKPVLGPILTLLIMELRDRCYYNPRTGERRDYCWPSQEELARAIGVSTRTVIRALQDPRAQTFIRIQHRYRYDAALGKKVRTSSAYVVAMDDPLLPEDEPKLTRMAAEQMLAREISERHQLQITSPPDLSDTLADRCTPAASDLTDRLADRSRDDLTANLSAINITDRLAEEEILSGHDSHQKKEELHPPSREKSTLKRGTTVRPARPVTQTSSNPTPDEDGGDFPFPPSRGEGARGREVTTSRPPQAPLDLKNELPVVPEPVLQTYSEANGRVPTPLEIRRLADLIERFESPARQAQPASSGAEWVRAAIIEAVDSGSSFVAPRRIATICERWARRGSRETGDGSRRRPESRLSDVGEQRSRAERNRSVDAAPPIEEQDRGPVDGNSEAESEDALASYPLTPDSRLATPSFLVGAGRPLTNRQLWRLVVDELAEQIPHGQDRAWLSQAALIGEADGSLIVGAPSRFARDLLERRFAEPIARVIATALGTPRPICFVVSQEWQSPATGAG